MKNKACDLCKCTVTPTFAMKHLDEFANKICEHDDLLQNINLDKLQTIDSKTELIKFGGDLAYFDGSVWEKKTGSATSNGGSYTGTIIVVSNSMYWKRNVDNNVYAEWFGAVGNGTTDDAAAINNAIAVAIELGVTTQLLGKTYAIASSILLRRGGRLKGSANIDDNNGTRIILKNSSNCVILKAGRAVEIGENSFMSIEAITFDGNASNQTVENDGVQFWGQFVGSYIRNVFITNTFGIALTLKGGIDLQIDHLWLLGNKSSSGYAFAINPDATSGYDGDVNINHIYVEYQRKTTNAALDVYSSLNNDKRCTPIYANRVISLNINSLHTEYTGGAILYNNCIKSKIDGYVGYDTGYDTDSSNHGVFETFDQNGVANLTILNAYTPYRSSTLNWVKSLSGSGNNNITPSPVNVDKIIRYESNINSVISANAMSELLVSNRLRIKGVGSYSPNEILIENSSNKGVKLSIADYIADISVSANQPSSVYKSFFQIQSFGNSGDKAIFGSPVYLFEKGNNSNTLNGGLYMVSGIPTISWGSNKATSISSHHITTSTPNYTPDIQNQFAFDNTNKKIYFSTGNSSSADWNPIVTGTTGELTLVSGTATVSNAQSKTTSRVFIQTKTNSGTVAHEYNYDVSIAGSITITARRQSDGNIETGCNATVVYQIIN